MKLLFDFLPVVVFYIVYMHYGIFIATAALVVTSFLQITLFWLKYRRFEKMYFIIFFIGLLMGGATLLFHNEMFIKWKPTAIYWILALAFLVSQFFGSKTLSQRMLESNVSVPNSVWQRINLSWIIFCVVTGAINIFVIYHYDTDVWVNFKLFGLLGITLIFAIGQALYLSRYIKSEEPEKS